MTTEEAPNNAEASAAGQEVTAAAAAGETDNRVARLGDLPVQWTQMGQQDGPEAPMNVIRYPSEVTDISKEETEIMIVGTAGKKITRIGPQFYKEASPDLTQLVLRSHLIKDMEGLEGFTKLELLELYDNMVDELKNLNDGEGGAPGMTLTNLDMSYNVIREMKPVEFCPNLQELCKSVQFFNYCMKCLIDEAMIAASLDPPCFALISFSWSNHSFFLQCMLQIWPTTN